MSVDRDAVARLFDQIDREQHVVDRHAASALRLQAIQEAKQELASMDGATPRRAVARRYPALAVGA
ncbi:MAG: hypothetical protein HZB48_04810 [Actinobacteria bacterium]|uniref:hypothetical protein n=1 Tax=Propionicimonas sp. T2.31MG-18 TaxID=3157620 RepID=UPI0035EE318A|nr:hypothetical protein [Actinomycetota bacterium]